MLRTILCWRALAVSAALALAACQDGSDGAAGAPGQDATTPGSGLAFEILSATAPATGQPTATFSVTDAQGVPLDLDAELAAGTLTPRWVIARRNADGTSTSLYEAQKVGAAWIDGSGASQPPALASATQAASPAVTAAAYTRLAAGRYQVSFAVPPTDADGTTYAYAPAPQDATVTVGVWGTRTWEGQGHPGQDTFAFVPAGGTPTAREVVLDSNCDACHRPMQAHDSRRTVALCGACHSPQTVDPETGHVLDLRAMMHQIHAGEDGYVVVGYRQRVHDYTDVVFPDLRNGVRNCSLCHGGGSTPRTYAIAACKGCHSELDDAHGGGGLCVGCHNDGTAPTMEVAHLLYRDPETNLTTFGQRLEISIDSVDADTSAPTVTFTVSLDTTPAVLTPTSLCLLPAGATYDRCGSLRFTIGGPTADFGTGVLNGAGSGFGYLQSVDFFDRRTTDNFALLTPTGTPGQYTAPLVGAADVAKLAAAAGTSVAVGVEAYTLEAKERVAGGCGTGALPSAPVQGVDCAVREWPAEATPLAFAVVGGGAAEPRRALVENARCNACHVDLGFHGGSARKGPDYCAICHHPNNVNEERSTRLEFVESPPGVPTATPFASTPESVNLMTMVHRIHAGAALSASYVLGVDRSMSATAPYADEAEFAGTFPADLADCEACHAPGTWGLPAPTRLGVLELTYGCTERAGDGDNWCDTLVRWPDAAAGTGDEFAVTSEVVTPPQTAACTSCHDSPAALGHAELNTVGVHPDRVETCVLCHGAGTTWDALEVHRRSP